MDSYLDPELDESPEWEEKLHTYYQDLIRMLMWTTELG